MPRKRPLSNISVNISPRKQLSSKAKNKIYGRVLAGESSIEIEAAENVPKPTIDYLLQRIIERETTNNLPRSGRPRIYDDRDERAVVRQVQLSPKMRYEDLHKATGFEFSNKVLRGILIYYGIINWRSKRRPALTEVIASIQLAFARAWINLDWSTVLFSDECSVEKGVGKERTWSFGYPHEKRHYDKVSEYPKGKQGSVMVWGAIGGSRTASKRSVLIVMERDSESKKNGYTSASYLDTLYWGLIPVYHGELFQQDNAPIHRML